MTGRRNHTVNKLNVVDSPAHTWYRFVLSFPPHLVADYLQRFGTRTSHIVLDPFCGTGTTLVECKKRGIPSVGVEANRMAWFAAHTKLDWTPDPDELMRNARLVAEQTYQSLEQDGIEDEPIFQRPVRAVLRKLPDEAIALLLSGSISPLPLHKILVLRDCIEQSNVLYGKDHMRLALAKILVTSVGNLTFGPEVSVTSPKEDSPVVSLWLAAVRQIADDLRSLRKLPEVSAEVRLADSRDVAGLLEPDSIDGVITSPPYPNEKDYTRTTRLEAVILGFLRTRDDLRKMKQGLLRSNTRNIYSEDRDDIFVAEFPEIQQIAETIETRRIALGKTSGFERLYGRTVTLYFGGMARHLASLRTALRPGAQLAYVVGDQASFFRVLIRTGHILADIAQRLGYELRSIDLFRTRFATATKEPLREEIVVLRWPG